MKILRNDHVIASSLRDLNVGWGRRLRLCNLDVLHGAVLHNVWLNVLLITVHNMHLINHLSILDLVSLVCKHVTDLLKARSLELLDSRLGYLLDVVLRWNLAWLDGKQLVYWWVRNLKF